MPYRLLLVGARAGGRRVLLGGHSLGASVAVAYASWDFAGHRGYRDLDGMVLIDGGLRGGDPRAGGAHGAVGRPELQPAAAAVQAAGRSRRPVSA